MDRFQAARVANHTISLERQQRKGMKSKNEEDRPADSNTKPPALSTVLATVLAKTERGCLYVWWWWWRWYVCVCVCVLRWMEMRRGRGMDGLCVYAHRTDLAGAARNPRKE
jgi:hypothetical protein